MTPRSALVPRRISEKCLHKLSASPLRALQSQCQKTANYRTRAHPIPGPYRSAISLRPPLSQRRILHITPTRQFPYEPTQPTPQSDEEYYERSEHFFERLLVHLEDLQEERGDMDVEYSAGVLNVVVPSQGTYVLNKQPPNKQIWLSSPLSGPKRYDWIVVGGDLETGDWIYLRDGSSLTQLLQKEIGVNLEGDDEY